MTRERDIIEDIFARIREILRGQYERELEQEEARVREDWGGTEPYIAKRRVREEVKKQALNDLNHGVPMNDVVSKTGISRAQVYRLLKHRK